MPGKEKFINNKKNGTLIQNKGALNGRLSNSIYPTSYWAAT